MQFRGQGGAQRMVHHRYTTLPCSSLRAGQNASVIALWQTHSNNKNA
ncbi:hypothetical protein BSLA_02f3908 [Burkholderia stabilis]|nr:hypothetical protein BSLA_02f3908 [Burkholderia stabilis]